MTQLETAKEILEGGGVIIFPTETVFGIGCLLSFPESVERLYKIKKRDLAKPTLVLVKNFQEASKLVFFNKAALTLAKYFWPGPLTISLPAVKNVPERILGPGNTLAIRVPSHPWLLSLLSYLDQPILAPSANFQNKPPAKKSSEIDKTFSKLVDYVVNIEPGGEAPSTVISFENQKDYKLIREGKITKKIIDQVLSKG